MNSDAITINRLIEENKAKDVYIRELLDDLELARDPDIRLVTREMVRDAVETTCNEIGLKGLMSAKIKIGAAKEIFGGGNEPQNRT